MNRASRLKVLFLCWGYSIHAYRRISIFVEDPGFEVAVASTYDYAFLEARNVLLPSALQKKYPEQKIFRRLVLEAIGIVKDYFALRKAVSSFKPDVLFLQTLLYPCHLAYLLPKSLPLFLTFWNGDLIWEAKWSGLDHLMKRSIVQYGVKRATGITVNSKSAFDICLRYGANSSDVALIRYPGVDSEVFHPLPRNEARRRLGISNSKIVLWPRGLGGYLNSDVFLHAAAEVTKVFPDTLFVMVSGAGKEQVGTHQRIAEELGIGRNFLWCGQIAWEDMPLYYCASDLMVSLSSNDSLPNTMLESMACGVPVVMADIPQIREWIVDGQNGFLVPPEDPAVIADRICALLTDGNDLSSRFAEANLDMVRREADKGTNSEKVKEFVRRKGTRR